MLRSIMDTIDKIIHDVKKLFGLHPEPLDKPVHGPNSLKELMEQFKQGPKEKTQSEIIRDYCVKETMASLEIDMLKMEPSTMFKGLLKWEYNNIKCFDWAYCAIRPEVVYCCYGKN